MNETNLIALLEELFELYDKKHGYPDKYAAMYGVHKAIIKHFMRGGNVLAAENVVSSVIIETRNEIAAAGSHLTDLANDPSNAGGGFLTSQP